jgi:hypothetical protein
MIRTTLTNIVRTTARRQLSALSDVVAAGDLSEAAKATIQLESKYGANNYAPLPVVLAKGKGMFSSFVLFLQIVRFSLLVLLNISPFLSTC